MNRLAETIHPIAAPSIMRRFANDPCTQGVQLNVALTGKEIGVVPHWRRFVATIPERACATVGLVDVLDVAPTQRHDAAADRLRCREREQQAHVIGHQHIGMQCAACFGESLS